MRSSIAAPATFALAGLLLAGLHVACGGAEQQDVLDTRTSSGNASGGNTSGGNTSGGNTSGGVADAAAPETSAECTQEVEPNDDEDSANVLAFSRCGAIQPNSESDFLTFQLSPKATSLQIKFDGKVTLRVNVDGDSVTLGEGEFPAVPFVKNERYFIEIKSTERAKSVPWRVDLIER